MQLVLSAYEKLGKSYLDHRKLLKSERYVRLLLNKLQKGSSILDIGCGVGVPVDDLLVKAGHEVVGVDISPTLIGIARKLVPQASYLTSDMRNLSPKEYQVGAVVCLYSLFHIPRSEHGRVLKVIASYLPIGGWLLISMGDRAFEGNHLMYGVQSYSSQWGSEANRDLIRSAGFEIEIDEIARSAGEAHQMILAKRKS